MRDGLPGEDLVRLGLTDLARGEDTIPALLVSIGAPSLLELGLAVPRPLASPEHRLYGLLHAEDPDSAHSRYNALVRRLVRFERAARCRLADEGRIRSLMRSLGADAREETRVYFTGGATAVMFGWRESTIDVDLHFEPESDRLLRALPRLKEELELNLELACPADFIPELPGWRERSPFVAREQRLSFHHYDLYAQVLAKIERGHAQDLLDVRAMLERGLIDAERALESLAAIEPLLYRYPAIDPRSFRRAAESALGG